MPPSGEGGGDPISLVVASPVAPGKTIAQVEMIELVLTPSKVEIVVAASGMDIDPEIQDNIIILDVPEVRDDDATLAMEEAESIMVATVVDGAVVTSGVRDPPDAHDLSKLQDANSTFAVEGIQS